MGTSHARAYHRLSADFEIVGLVSRGASSRRRLNAELGGRYDEFSDYTDALASTQPDAVCISTYSETHAEYAIAALDAGAHVFLEKPLADSIADAERVIAAAARTKRALVIGYILQVTGSFAWALTFVGVSAAIALLSMLLVVGEIHRVELKTSLLPGASSPW